MVSPLQCHMGILTSYYFSQWLHTILRSTWSSWRAFVEFCGVVCCSFVFCSFVLLFLVSFCFWERWACYRCYSYVVMLLIDIGCCVDCAWCCFLLFLFLSFCDCCCCCGLMCSCWFCFCVYIIVLLLFFCMFSVYISRWFGCCWPFCCLFSVSLFLSRFLPLPLSLWPNNAIARINNDKDGGNLGGWSGCGGKKKKIRGEKRLGQQRGEFFFSLFLIWKKY